MKNLLEWMLVGLVVVCIGVEGYVGKMAPAHWSEARRWTIGGVTFIAAMLFTLLLILLGRGTG
jgi:uncharacterized membrane protein